MEPLIRQYFIFFFVSIVVSIGIQMILPFPYGLITALAIFILLPFYLRWRIMKKQGISGSFFGAGIKGYMDKVELKYECMRCGKVHKKSECPVCGSKMRRAMV